LLGSDSPPQLAYPSVPSNVEAWSDSEVGNTNLAKTVDSPSSKPLDVESVGVSEAGHDSDVELYIVLPSL
jgi:hypothetical protein